MYLYECTHIHCTYKISINDLFLYTKQTFVLPNLALWELLLYRLPMAFS